MRSSVSRITVVLLVALLASSTIFAKSKKESIEFPTDIKVNGTLVRKGTYDVKFDEQTGELSIIKDKKVIATAAVTAEKRGKKAEQFSLLSIGTGSDRQLIGFTFSGADQDLRLNGSQASR
ncbi:MAG TPA: hypothetical protein VLL54_18905 [Pyrinomonadaceae bacterium]|nr:hypothetical protein [Pyrinomonadaceae bacterium]